MKNYLSIIGVFILVSVTNVNAMQPITIKAPNIIPVFREAPELVQGWAQLLRDGKLEEFYQQVHQYQEFIGAMDWDELKEGDLNKFLWICYYVAKAPAFQVDYDENTDSSNHEGLDYRERDNLAGEMLRMCWSLPEIVSQHGLKRKELVELLSLYTAAMTKTLRDGYDDDLAEKHAKMADEYEKIVQKRMKDYAEKHRGEGNWGSGDIEKKRVYYYNKLASNEVRNYSAAHYLKNSLEPALMKILLQCFPGDKNEVEKYLKLAGYGGKAMDELINRTMGRDASTEFLYQGDRGRRYEQKLGQQTKKKK